MTLFLGFGIILATVGLFMEMRRLNRKIAGTLYLLASVIWIVGGMGDLLNHNAVVIMDVFVAAIFSTKSVQLLRVRQVGSATAQPLPIRRGHKY